MKKYIVFLLTFCLLGITSAALASTGAIWTTDSTCGGVNINLYACKAFVYLNGGPSGGGGGLPDGYYYVKVTDPSTNTLLGQTAGATAQVVNGSFVTCYKLYDILFKASNGQPGYDTTPNNGNEYKVTVSQNALYSGGTTKTDNFKAKCCVDSDGCCTPDNCGGGGGGGGGGTSGSISGTKFLDQNLSGSQDPSVTINTCSGSSTGTEPGIDGWKINLYKWNNTGAPTICSDVTTNSSWSLVGTIFTSGGGAYSFDPIATPGYYAVAEVFPLKPSCGAWQPTSLATCYIVDFSTTFSAITGENFGNICYSTAGLTIGYWKEHAGFGTPKKDPIYNSIGTLGIVLGGGYCSAPMPPYASTDAYVINTTQKAYNIFLLADASGDGKKMLAAQLLGAKLNVEKFTGCGGFNCAIYAGNVSAYFLQSVKAIIAAADGVLCDPTATKTAVTDLITVLDQINNNATTHVLENPAGGCA